MFILTLLVFSLGCSNAYNESIKTHLNCSSNMKCPKNFSPLCVNIKHKGYTPEYIKVQNKCAMEKLKCRESTGDRDIKVTVVPMKKCEIRNIPDVTDESARRGKKNKYTKKLSNSKVNMQMIKLRLKSKNLNKTKLGYVIQPSVHFGFVVDVAALSRNMLPKIQNVIKQMSIRVFEDSSNSMDGMLLTVYAWPVYNGTYVTWTSQFGDFSEAVDLLVHLEQGSPTCVQNVYQATIASMEKAMPNTHLYVFVSGMPSEQDIKYKSEAARLGREKNIKVNFIGTGQCTNSVGYEKCVHMFYDVAADTKGQVLRMEPDDMMNVLNNYITATVIDFETEVVVSQVIQNNQFRDTRIPFKFTEELASATVLVSGENISCTIFDNRNRTIEDYINFVDMPHIKVYQYRMLELGIYYIRIHSEHPTRCALVTVITSNLEFRFIFGFPMKDDNPSVSMAVSGEVPNPKAGHKQFLVIYQTTNKESVSVTYAELLDLSGKMMAQHALQRLDHRTYVTKEIEITNKKKFKVAVIGKDMAMQKPVKIVDPRIARPYTEWPHEMSKEKVPEVNDGKGSYSNEKESTEHKETDADHEYVPEYTNEETKEKNRNDYDSPEYSDYGASVEKRKLSLLPAISPKIVRDTKYKCERFKDKWIVQRKCRVTNVKSFETKWVLDLFKNGIDNTKGVKKQEIITTKPGNDIDIVVDQRKFEGLLTCRIKNDNGEDNVTIKIRCPKKKDELMVTKKLRDVSGKLQSSLKVTNFLSRWVAHIGENVDLKCQIAVGKRHPKITWEFKDMSSSKYQFLKQTGIILSLKSTKQTDSGYYRCVAKNKRGTNTQIILLTLLERQQSLSRIQNLPISVPETRLLAYEGEDVDLKCLIAVGRRQPEISWKFKKNQSSKYRTLRQTEIILSLKSVTEKRSGFYKCVVKRKKGTDEQTIQLTVLQYYASSEEAEYTEYDNDYETNLVPPKVKKMVNSLAVVLGNRIRFGCKILEGYPPPSMRWEHKVFAKGARWRRLKSTTTYVNIPSVKHEDAGYYKCIAENEAGTAHDIIPLNVKGKAERTTTSATSASDLVPPKVYITPNFAMNAGGGSASFECFMDAGNPPPSFKWEHRGLSDSSQWRRLKSTEPKLTVSSLKTTDAGNYKCTAENEAGTGYAVALLTMSGAYDPDSSEDSVFPGLVKPKLGRNSMTQATLGHELTINCKILAGKPPPTMRWEHRDFSESSRWRHLKYTTEEFTIPSLKEEHAGNYKCIAENKAGKARGRFEVILVRTYAKSSPENDKTLQLEMTKETTIQPTPNIIVPLADYNDNHKGDQSGGKRGVKIRKNNDYTCEKFNGKWIVRRECRLTKGKPAESVWILRLQHGKNKRRLIQDFEKLEMKLDHADEVSFIVHKRTFQGQLTCIAKNSDGKDEYTIDIRCPKRSEIRAKKLLTNSLSHSKSLPCTAFKNSSLSPKKLSSKGIAMTGGDPECPISNS